MLPMQVYKERRNGNLVTVKALNRSAEEVEEELQREAAILSKLRHSHSIGLRHRPTAAELSQRLAMTGLSQPIKQTKT